MRSPVQWNPKPIREPYKFTYQDAAHGTVWLTAIVALFTAWLSGCSSVTRTDLYGSEGVAFDVPAAKRAWISLGYPDPSECEPMRMIEVSADEFEARCELPSCFTDSSHTCAYACSDGFGVGLPTMFYVPEVDHSVEIEQAHESMHGWIYCLLGDITADSHHFRGQVWKTAMPEVEKMLKEYSNSR